MIGTESRTAIDVLRVIVEEGFSKGNLDALDEVFAPGYVEHQPGSGPDVAGLKRNITGLRTAFSDFSLEIEETVADGDALWARLKGRGTHDGPFFGIAPTGKSFEIDVFDVIRVRDGKLTEHWGVPDRMSVMEQLGLMPGGPGL